MAGPAIFVFSRFEDADEVILEEVAGSDQRGMAKGLPCILINKESVFSYP